MLIIILIIIIIINNNINNINWKIEYKRNTLKCCNNTDDDL